ncbi:MAG TPA: DUF465 domain-containing protein [bacterium]|nr:DUF465 domain-containing protein [bacterium]
MDQHIQEQLEALGKTDPEIASLIREHRALDEQVTHLSEKTHLTPEEDIELHRLKKEKLLLKDRLEAVIHQQKSA